MAFPRRIAWIAALVLGSLCPGFVAGGAVGGFFFVPHDSGLAGGATVFLFAIAGAAASAIGAAIAATKLSERSLRKSASIALLLSAALIAFLAYRVISEQQAQAQPTPPSREPTVPTATPPR